MRSDLSHLPAAKQRDLERVLAILFEEFEDATGRALVASGRSRRILKVVLYGSYARGAGSMSRIRRRAISPTSIC